MILLRAALYVARRLPGCPAGMQGITSESAFESQYDAKAVKYVLGGS